MAAHEAVWPALQSGVKALKLWDYGWYSELISELSSLETLMFYNYNEQEGLDQHVPELPSLAGLQKLTFIMSNIIGCC